MAGSKYAYVKNFELPDPLLPGTFLVVRIDGHAFHRFTDAHGFVKPNDERGLCLMDDAARFVMDEYRDIVLAFGESDEFSFLFRRPTELYGRRAAKILTTIVSHFTAAYIFGWTSRFPDTPLLFPPTFDGRIVMYPSSKEVRDYFAWRQVDTHINNLYNTAFWALVQQGGLSKTKAFKTLEETASSQKHEILFSRFGINYNNLPARFRKGSVLVRELEPDVENKITDPASSQPPQGMSTTASLEAAETQGTESHRKRQKPVVVLHTDLIGDAFWNQRLSLLDEGR